MKRYFVFFFKEGKIFVVTNDSEFPSIAWVQEMYQKEDKVVYSFVEFLNKEDYMNAQREYCYH